MIFVDPVEIPTGGSERFDFSEGRDHWHRHDSAWHHPAGRHCFKLEAGQ